MFNLLIGSIHISLVPFKLHYLKCRLVQIGTFNGNKIPLSCLTAALVASGVCSRCSGRTSARSSSPASTAQGTVLGGHAATTQALRPQPWEHTDRYAPRDV